METPISLEAVKLSLQIRRPVWFDNDFCDGMNWQIFPVGFDPRIGDTGDTVH